MPLWPYSHQRNLCGVSPFLKTQVGDALVHWRKALENRHAAEKA
ncbi:hypothetical protein CZ787_05500 [Halomonas citrativorans]|uniref:Uncharacterized protein n=1 Tax=Halomonas citrativorans TaxID=2742612 RepID=A0A1R4HUJ7_9GAMM|nr:hypothetical protein CZ787_05500 [Halomonas citrativorans]